ncbi:hypothetical protein GCM10010994_33160 [Chelatococcus reniformis]|uniref:Uncharacterized protein n=1 Tax=Chelatococcus reniformis TaxID=1494448 RepID=A0A916UFY7_9HYPH|nr:hypothetical protein GCM10010994_33160 [Chelatococcus reniformis]
MRLPETFTEWVLTGSLALLFLLFVKAYEILAVLRRSAAQARSASLDSDDRRDLTIAINQVEGAVNRLEHTIREIARADALDGPERGN